jgi:hypothetical protein
MDTPSTTAPETGVPASERAAWTCENCRRVTAWPRKRCAGCGTSRY